MLVTNVFRQALFEKNSHTFFFQKPTTLFLETKRTDSSLYLNSGLYIYSKKTDFSPTKGKGADIIPANSPLFVSRHKSPVVKIEISYTPV